MFQLGPPAAACCDLGARDPATRRSPHQEPLQTWRPSTAPAAGDCSRSATDNFAGCRATPPSPLGSAPAPSGWPPTWSQPLTGGFALPVPRALRNPQEIRFRAQPLPVRLPLHRSQPAARRGASAGAWRSAGTDRKRSETAPASSARSAALRGRRFLRCSDSLRSYYPDWAAGPRVSCSRRRFPFMSSLRRNRQTFFRRLGGPLLASGLRSFASPGYPRFALNRSTNSSRQGLPPKKPGQ
jgi:hypothetical protein